ncbi:hypothetical protein ACFVWR_09400 [Leifsonia sp. NPDC058292]|uniref:hypothetical protein n=1 Tax=Leifsonia sp. NPDC058292 TaxID=3346428 RepID=UPI0036D8152A
MTTRALAALGRTRTRTVAIAVGVIAALSVVLGFSVTPTSAGFADQGRLTLQSMGADFGFGAIRADGTVVLPDENGTIEGSFTAVDHLVPGTTARLKVGVFGNSESVRTAISLALPAGSVTGDTASALRFSAVAEVDGAQTVLFGDPDDPAGGSTAAELGEQAANNAGVTVLLAARELPPLGDGATWSGPAGSRATITLVVHLLDTPELSATNAGAAAIGFRITGASD